MKIIHILYGMGLGGIETMLINIANEQAKNNNVGIIVINNIIEPSLIKKLDSKVNLYLLKRKVASLNPVFIIKLNYLLYKFHPDIIHLHQNSIWRFLFYRNSPCKTCVTQHDVCTPENSGYLHKCKYLFSVSNTVKEDIFREKKRPSKVVFNGIRPELIKGKELLSSESPTFKIVQSGRLFHQKKGQHILIEAIKIVKERGIDTIRLFFIGEGESEKYLKEMVKNFHLDDIVSFLGTRTQDFIFQNLCQYDLLVQPSIYEGFGLTVTEGMAAKIPVLVSKNQGPMEIIDNGKYGYYFENGSPESCAGMILKIMNDPDKTSMVEKAYQRVLELYDVSHTARNYLQEYKKIVSEK
jgi:glycosyltransferase involved in cell wall biosynthesis